MYDYLDEGLSRRRRAAVEAHLACCPACRAAYAAERAFAQRMHTALTDATADMDAAPDLVFKANAALARTTTVHTTTQGVRMQWLTLHKALAFGIVACLILVVSSVTFVPVLRHDPERARLAAARLDQDVLAGSGAPHHPAAHGVSREIAKQPAPSLPAPVASTMAVAAPVDELSRKATSLSSSVRGRIDSLEAGEPFRHASLPPAVPAVAGAMAQRGRTLHWQMQAEASDLACADTDAPLSQPAPQFDTEDYSCIYENEFLDARNNPLSTFSIDVDSASYANVRRFITLNKLPPKDAVRIEEMINYFRYDYPQPDGAHPFTITTEAAPCPWNAEHTLVMIGLQGQEIAMSNLPPNNLVFLIDVSGSMFEPNKLPLVKASLKLLIQELRPQDRVALVVYAGAAGVVLDSTAGDDKARIIAALDKLQAGGSTAGGAGIQRAYMIAKQNFITGGNNRVILATDGDFNVGASSDSELVRMIEERRGDGIYLTVLGFGMGNYKDNKMEQLADKGNGNYAYIDSLMEAKKVLLNELGATLLTIANDVKLQIEFNPAVVKAYRLIGYENRMLKNEDFNDDKKDAGELGAGHNVTAFYEIVPPGSTQTFASVDPLKYQTAAPQQSDELLTVKFRYKRPGETNSLLLAQALSSKMLATGAPSETFRFASAVAEFGLLLRDSEFKGSASLTNVLARARSAKGADDEGYRAEFIRMVEQAGLLK